MPVHSDAPGEAVKAQREYGMLRLLRTWLSNYATLILLVSVLVNVATQMSRNAYGLTLPSMRGSLDLSYSQAASLITALSICLIASSLVFGMLASRYGSRIIVGFATIATGVAMILLGSAGSFSMALAASGLIGLSAGACTTPVMGLLSTWFTSRHRGTVAGLAASGGGISFMIMGAVAPWLTGRNPEDGWRHTWYLLSLAVIAIGVLSLAFLRDSPRPPSGSAPARGVWPMAAYRSRLVWVITFLAFCSGWGFGIYTTFFAVYLEEEGIGLAVSGRLWGLLGLLGIGSGVLWGGVSDRLGRRLGFLLSFVAYGTGCLVFWLTPVMAGFLASVVLVGISFRAAYTICAAAAGDYVGPRFSAAAFGLMGMGAGLGQATGPLIGGRVADATGTVGWVFVLAAGSAAVAVFGSTFLSPPSPRP